MELSHENVVISRCSLIFLNLITYILGRMSNPLFKMSIENISILIFQLFTFISVFHTICAEFSKNWINIFCVSISISSGYFYLGNILSNLKWRNIGDARKKLLFCEACLLSLISTLILIITRFPYVLDMILWDVSRYILIPLFISHPLNFFLKSYALENILLIVSLVYFSILIMQNIKILSDPNSELSEAFRSAIFISLYMGLFIGRLLSNTMWYVSKEYLPGQNSDANSRYAHQEPYYVPSAHYYDYVPSAPPANDLM